MENKQHSVTGSLECLQIHKWNLHCNCQFLNSVYLISLTSSLCFCASSTPAPSSKWNRLPRYQFLLLMWTGCTIAAHNNICVAGERCFPPEHPRSICFFSYQNPKHARTVKRIKKGQKEVVTTPPVYPLHMTGTKDTALKTEIWAFWAKIKTVQCESLH